MQTAYPFDAGPGANVTEDQWAKMARLWERTGVVRGELNGLAVTATGGGMNVTVASGRAWIEGFFYENDAPLVLPIGASDPVNPRIDRIVARLDHAANTITATVIAGVPAGVPVAPAATQGAVTWDVTLATVLVPAGAVVIGGGNVTDRRTYSAPILDRLDFRSDIDTTSDASITRTGAAALQVNAGLTVAGTLHVTGAATLDTTANVLGAFTASSTLHGVGAATLDSTLNVAGALTASSTLHGVGAATLDSTLNVGAKLTIAGGGMDLTGSPSGYHDELRFPNTGAARLSAITTLSTGSPVMTFGHRGTSNTGSWQWGNSTNASSVVMTLSPVGLLGVIGGLDITGSPTGYSDEIRFPSTGSGRTSALSTSSPGSPAMAFDHRAASNAGVWTWRNGSGAGTTRLSLAANGNLTVTGELHVPSKIVGDLTSNVIGLVPGASSYIVMYRPDGVNPYATFGAGEGSALAVYNAAGSTYLASLYGDAGATSPKYRFATGSFASAVPDWRFGAGGALGGSVANAVNLWLYAPAADANVYLTAEGGSTYADVGLNYRTKGNGTHRLYSSAGGVQIAQLGPNNNYLMTSHSQFGMGSLTSGAILDVYADTGAADVWLYARGTVSAGYTNMQFRAYRSAFYDDAGNAVVQINRRADAYAGSGLTTLALAYNSVGGTNHGVTQVQLRSGFAIRTGLYDNDNFLSLPGL